jgi:hypothetical protein
MSFRIENPTASWQDLFAQVVADLNTAIGISSSAQWSGQRSTAFNTYAVQMVDVLPGTSPMLQQALATQGEIADDVMPPNDSLCITLRTDVKGRTGRGRIYLNGYPEGSANGGYWEAVAQSDADLIAGLLLSNFQAPPSGASMTWGVISRFEFGVKREIPAFTPITSYTVHNEVRSLRRRAVGVRISRHRAA